MLKYACEGARGDIRRCLIVILYDHGVLKRIKLVLPYGNKGKWC